MKQNKIAIIGLGYVGLPIFNAFKKKYNVIGYDINKERIKNLLKGIDVNNQVKKKDLNSKNNNITSNFAVLKNCNIFIVTVPTPINNLNKPDLSNLINVSNKIGKILKKNDLVIYESTVYPGVTEEICVKILEKKSKLKLNKDFLCGYSPERINPGDDKKTLEKIVKITSGSNKKALKQVNMLYSSIIKAGIYPVSSIQIAESAKVIENTQRDINIAFINEISMIFDKLNIDKYEVLTAANTKWNFLNFKPGLVGGHCIGVDPYYLAYRAKQKKILPKIILSGREINENYVIHVINKIKNILNEKYSKNMRLNILFLGFTFKSNCPDTRNSKVFKIMQYFAEKYSKVHAYDPMIVNLTHEKKIYNKINFLNKIANNKYYNVIILSVDHDIFKKNGINFLLSKLSKKGIIIDLKNIFKKQNPQYIKI